MLRGLHRSLFLHVLLVLLLLEGTPDILMRVSANEYLAQAAIERAQSERLAAVHGNSHSVRSGELPPADDFLDRQLHSTPTLSGANLPYPVNHVLETDPQPVDIGLENNDFEAPGFDVGAPPSNHDFETPATAAGSPLTNHDFETGDFTGWTTSGTVTMESDTERGYWGRLAANGALITDAFTVDPEAHAVVFDVGFLSTSAIDYVYIYALTGSAYDVSTQLTYFSCNRCANWEDRYVDLTAYAGQSIKLRFYRSGGAIGLDNVRIQTVFPDYTVTGGYRPSYDNGNTYARLYGSGTALVTSPLLIDDDAQFVTLRMTGLSTGSDQYYVYVRSGPDFATSTQVGVGTIADQWTTLRFNIAQWRGQEIKLRVQRHLGTIGVDDIGIQRVDITGWDVTGDTRLEAHPGGGHFVSTNGNLVSPPITFPTGLQHISIDYRAATSTGTAFYVELLRGENFSQVTQLDYAVASDHVHWNTLTLGVEPYAGETVKLRVRRYVIGRLQVDNVGLGESVLPSWTLRNHNALGSGEDEYGAFVTTVSGALNMRSTDISNGIKDGSTTNRRFYSTTYGFGAGNGNIFRVTWINAQTGESWVVHTDASNGPAPTRTRYFWLAGFMGYDGYFIVQVPTNGRFYSIGDNIAREHLVETFSQKVGLRVDTSTGTFGYDEHDLATSGSLPLSFSRYYAGHFARPGVMGYGWSHSYEIRLEITSNGDAGVILGSGREIFFDWNSIHATYKATDSRVHDKLVKHGDGSYTYTTTSNLRYHFDATGTLLTVQDLNDNTLTFDYTVDGLLETVTGPGGQALDFSYTADGRLETVTDPVGAVWTYAYDANGDLTSVTDPEGGVRSYSYHRHRLVQVVDPLGRTLFTNTLDSQHRVITQTDADGKTITISYDAPGRGATQVTDPEGNTATYYFDRFQRTTDMVDPLGRVITRHFDTSGKLVRVIDPAFNEWSFAYNSSGDLTSQVDPLNHGLTIDYNPQHLPTTITDGRGNTTNLAYDSKGNLTSITDPLNNVTTFTYDNNGNLLTETDPLNNTVTYTYNGAGNMLTRTDGLGQTWSYTYNNRGQLTSVVDPLGGTISYGYSLIGLVNRRTNQLGHQKTWTYNLWGEITSETDEAGNKTFYTYDAKGNLTSITDPAGGAITYTYDSNGNLLTKTDQLSNTWTYAYDANNRLVSHTDPLGSVTAYAYDNNGRLASETDPLGRITTYGYDDAGRMTSRIMPNLGLWTYTYDASGNLTTVTDPLSQSTTYHYDANNRRVSVTNPRGYTTAMVYDAAGQLVAVTDAMNQTTTYSYDASGRLLSQTTPLGTTWHYAHDAAGNRISLTNPLGEITSFTYDLAGQMLSITDPLGNSTLYSYNATGRRTQAVLPSGSSVGLSYDSRGLITSLTDQLNNVITYSFDASGRRISETNRLGHTTSYGFDPVGRMTTMSDALGGTVTFGYDAAGQLVNLTNPTGHSTTYTYDELGNLLTQTDPLNRSVTYTYDAMGRQVSRSDPRGVTVTSEYDENGNPTEIQFPSGTIAYSYDALDQRTAMVDHTGTTSWTYDHVGQVTSVASPNGTVQYSYDHAGRRQAMTLPNNRTLAYVYDHAGRISSVTDWQNQTISFMHDADGNRTAIMRPNGVISSFTYDPAGRITAIDHSGSGCQCTLQSFINTYDDENNRTSVLTASGLESYTYDALNRLTQVQYPDGEVVAYTYDLNGNRLTKDVNSTRVATYSYDVAGQLVSDGTHTYSYDEAGNVIAAGSAVYSWDWANRLVSATVNGSSETYTYDGDGVRVSTSNNASTESYLWDRLGDVELLVDDGARAFINVGGVLAEIEGGSSYSPLGDSLGSVRGLTDATGDLVGTAAYAAFGERREQTGTESAFGFTGEQQSSVTGDTYLRARYLNSETGRFLSADTVQPNAPGTQGYNLYAYAANNPATWTDPTGHAVVAPFLLANWLPIALGIAALFVVECALGSPFGVCSGIAAFVITVFIVVACVLEIGGPCWGSGQINNEFPEREYNLPPGGSRPNLDPNCSEPCPLPNIAMPWDEESAMAEVKSNVIEAEKHYWPPWFWTSAFGSAPMIPSPFFLIVLPDLSWLTSMVRPGGPWDYKHPGGPGLADFGNWHYGVITAAMGIPLSISACAGGIVQLGQWLMERRPLGLVCGDDPKDSAQIADGWRWYRRCGGMF